MPLRGGEPRPGATPTLVIGGPHWSQGLPGQGSDRVKYIQGHILTTFWSGEDFNVIFSPEAMSSEQACSTLLISEPKRIPVPPSPPTPLLAPPQAVLSRFSKSLCSEFRLPLLCPGQRPTSALQIPPWRNVSIYIGGVPRGRGTGSHAPAVYYVQSQERS